MKGQLLSKAMAGTSLIRFVRPWLAAILLIAPVFRGRAESAKGPCEIYFQPVHSEWLVSPPVGSILFKRPGDPSPQPYFTARKTQVTDGISLEEDFDLVSWIGPYVTIARHRQWGGGSFEEYGHRTYDLRRGPGSAPVDLADIWPQSVILEQLKKADFFKKRLTAAEREKLKEIRILGHWDALISGAKFMRSTIPGCGRFVGLQSFKIQAIEASTALVLVYLVDNAGDGDCEEDPVDQDAGKSFVLRLPVPESLSGMTLIQNDVDGPSVLTGACP